LTSRNRREDNGASHQRAITEGRTINAVVVYEWMFGNTKDIAIDIADGLACGLDV